MPNITDLVDRYVRLWNEPDQHERRRAVRDLWASGGRQVLEPPKEVKDAAADLGFPAATLEVRGHEELDVRVARAHADFVAPGTFAFRRRSEPVHLQDIVTFTWEMVPVAGGGPAGVGRDVFLLDDEGRIRVDYQFIEA